jgi:hypothetical protein
MRKTGVLFVLTMLLFLCETNNPLNAFSSLFPTAKANAGCDWAGEFNPHLEWDAESGCHVVETCGAFDCIHCPACTKVYIPEDFTYEPEWDNNCCAYHSMGMRLKVHMPYEYTCPEPTCPPHGEDIDYTSWGCQQLFEQWICLNPPYYNPY